MFDLFLEEQWKGPTGKSGPDGKLKFPITFHDQLVSIDEIQNLSLTPPKKKEQIVKVVELGKKNKNKKGLF